MISKTSNNKRSFAASPAQTSYYRVLSIAGSDSGGGAGVQADIKTICALGCYASTAITALTAQNTHGVHAVYPVPADFLQAQMDAVLSDIGADSIKIGMVASLENLRVITRTLSGVLNRTPSMPMVFDPVMKSSTGTSLLSESEDFELTERVLDLMRVATLFTPNLDEASYLLGSRVSTPQQMVEGAAELINRGARAVLIKGGHLEGGDINGSNLKTKNTSKSAVVTDVLMDSSRRPLFFQSPRIVSANLHGTGCTLSSAVACFLARGMTVQSAVQAGRDYLLQAVSMGAAAQFSGSGPLNHGFAPQAMYYK